MEYPGINQKTFDVKIKVPFSKASVEVLEKPIVDEDLKVLYNYFSTQRAYLWDEIGHRDVKPEEFEKLEMYFKAIREINDKLIENLK